MSAGAFNALLAIGGWLLVATLFGAALGAALKRLGDGKVAAGRETGCFGRGGGSEIATGRRVTNANQLGVQTSQTKINSTSKPRFKTGQGGF